MGLGTRGFRSLAKSDLRASSAHLSGAIRYLFDRASTTGKVHRLVIDLGDGKYWAEVSDDRFYVPHEAETEADLRRREEKEAEQDEEKRRKRGAERQALDGERSRLVSRVVVVVELRSVEARDRRLSAQAGALRGVQGAGAQAGGAQEGEGPQRLHAAGDRSRSPPAAPTSTSSRSGRPSPRSSPSPIPRSRASTRWSSTRSRAGSASTTRRSARPVSRDQVDDEGTRVVQ